MYLHEIFLDFLYFGLVFCHFLVELLLLEVLLLLRLLDVDVEVLLLLKQLSQLILVFEFVGDEGVELLRGIVLDELDCVQTYVLSSYNLVMRLRRSLLTLKESRSRSGFSLNSLHSFLVLSLRIMERLAISISISSSSAWGERYTSSA